MVIVFTRVLGRLLRKGKGIPPGAGIFQHVQQQLSPGLNEMMYVKV